jgi:exodeoxyribonuclease V beta subunit
MIAWSPTAPLRVGTTLIEASAGTGKTHGITTLVLRLIAEEGLPIDRILVVTYTRAATAELEDRIRSRLVAADRALASAAPATDPVVEALRANPASRRRIAAAIEAFDTAVISTIHGFCQRMLQQNAFESGTAFDLELVADTDAILDDLVDDALVRAFYRADPEEIAFLRERCLFNRTDARSLARKALADPDLAVVPRPDAAPAAAVEARAAHARAVLVEELRRTFEQHKIRRRAQTYQDLLRGLARRLDPAADPAQRDGLIAAIGDGFDAALIDEFQDTDALQWTLFSTVFGAGRHHLYLIGDPKQAIYAFRGANIHVYGQAAHSAGGRRFTLDANWRSDAALLRALDRVMNHPHFFGPRAGFGFIPVTAAGPVRADPLPGAPLEIRWIEPALVGADGRKPLGKSDVQAALPAVVAADVARILAGGGSKPGEIAVLVRTGPQAHAIHAALSDAGIPAVQSGAASVLASDEALAVQQWLEALVASGGRSASRVAASSLLFGWTADRLLALEAREPAAMASWDIWLTQLARWRTRMAAEGFTPAFGAALADCDVLVRLLRAPDGERRVTNLLHLAELLDAVERQERLGLATLLGWLKQRRGDEELEADEIELRLDRDADAVQILTMHKAKGLEFTVTLLPYLWDGLLLRPGDRHALVVPDPADPVRRLLDVHPSVPRAAPSTNRQAAEREAQEEALRLAYVALTRAKRRCLLYTGFIRDLGTSALAAFLHGSGEDRLTTGAARVAEGPAALLADLRALAAEGSGVALTLAQPGEPAVPPPRPIAEFPLGVRVFRRGALDTTWRRHSYTSVVRAAGHAEPEVVEAGREGFDDDARAAEAAEPLPATLEVPLAGFPSGADAGTLLHEILEHLDFGSPAGFADEVAVRLAAHGFDAARWTRPVAVGLRRAHATPLDGPLGRFRLSDLRRDARLDELRFDLPLGRHVEGRAIASALRGADLPDTWLASLDRLTGMRLAGFLTGSIDLVFRADERWWVVDYKSNRLVVDGACTPAAFAPDRISGELARHDYFLQYHLYLVALHRYLGWRLGPAYDYDRHVGGAYYLFLRGMTGEPGSGCFFDRPSRAVVVALDHALGAA